MPRIEFIDLDDDRVYLNDGQVLGITHYFDGDGEECLSDDGLCCVAGPMRNGEWLNVDLTEVEPVTFH